MIVAEETGRFNIKSETFMEPFQTPTQKQSPSWTSKVSFNFLQHIDQTRIYISDITYIDSIGLTRGVPDDTDKTNFLYCVQSFIRIESK